MRTKMVVGCNCDVKASDSLKHKVWEMAHNTSMHGLPKVAKSSMYLRKILWALVFLSGLGMFIWQTATLVLKYTDYPTSTTVELKYAGALKFPAVTFCNINPVRQSSLDRNRAIKNMLGETTQETGADPDFNYSSEPDSDANFSLYPDVDLGGLDGIILNNTYEYEEFDWDTFEDTAGFFEDLDTYVKEEFDFLLQYMAMNDSERTFMGHSLKKMLLSCTFSGYKCGPRNFSHSLNFKYGNCYTFNSGTIYPEHITYRTGPTYGLSLEIYIEHYKEYIEKNSDSAGIKLVIHNQSSMPFPEDSGYSIAPGTKTSVAMSSKEIERVDPPYGKCTTYSNAENAVLNVYSGEPNLDISYSEKACSKTCVQKQLITKCKCCSYNYRCSGPALEDVMAENGGNVRFCNYSVETEVKCVDEVFESFQKNSLTCLSVCKPPCREFTYTVDISSSKWPSQPHTSVVSRLMKKKNKELKSQLDKMTKEKKREFVSDNVLKIQVFFKSLNYEKLSTKPSYSAVAARGWEKNFKISEVKDLDASLPGFCAGGRNKTTVYKETSLISDIGGQMGLWLGLSVVTLFEFAELFVDLLAIMCLRLRGHGQISSSSFRKKSRHSQQYTGNTEVSDKDTKSVSLYDMDGSII